MYLPGPRRRSSCFFLTRTPDFALKFVDLKLPADRQPTMMDRSFFVDQASVSRVSQTIPGFTMRSRVRGGSVVDDPMTL